MPIFRLSETLQRSYTRSMLKLVSIVIRVTDLPASTSTSTPRIRPPRCSGSSLWVREVHWDGRPADADYVIMEDSEGNRFCIVDRPDWSGWDRASGE